MKRSSLLRILAASVLVAASLTCPVMAETTVQQWWDSVYGQGSFVEDACGPDTSGMTWCDPEARAIWQAFETSHQGYWQNHLHGPVMMVLEEAGWANQNTFGWVEYDPTRNEAGVLNQIFAGADGPGTEAFVTIGPVDYFAFYLTTADNKTYYSVKELNTDEYQSAWIFDDPLPLNPNHTINHVLCWEDQSPAYHPNTDHDRNDMIVRMSHTAVPEPATVALLALGLPIAYLRRRSKKA